MADYQAMKPETTTDPFFVVKDRVQTIQTALSFDFERWQALLNGSNTAQSTEFQDLLKKIRVNLQQMGVYVKDLQQTIIIVEKQRAKFPQITDMELASRKKFIQEMRTMSNNIDDALTNTRTQQKMARDSRLAVGMSRPTQPDSTPDQESDYVADAKMAQTEIDNKQDEILGDMESILGRLSGISGGITDELKVHKVMLEEADDKASDVKDLLNVAMKKMDKLLGQSNNGRLCLIMLLFLICIALFFALIYG